MFVHSSISVSNRDGAKKQSICAMGPPWTRCRICAVSYQAWHGLHRRTTRNHKYEPNALHAMMQVAYQDRGGKNSHTTQ